MGAAFIVFACIAITDLFIFVSERLEYNFAVIGLGCLLFVAYSFLDLLFS